MTGPAGRVSQGDEPGQQARLRLRAQSATLRFDLWHGCAHVTVSAQGWTVYGGSVNLKVNREPRASRQIYHNGQICEDFNKCSHLFSLYYLQVGQNMPAQREFDKLPNRPDVLGALNMIDQLLTQGRPVPKAFMERIAHKSVKMWEIKAPQRGTQISRLLAYSERDWTMFLALAREKKTNKLPSGWLKTAYERITAALQEGGTL